MRLFRPFVRPVVVVLMCVAGSAAAQSAPPASKRASPPRAAASGLVVRGAWSRPALAGGTGAVYLSLENTGNAAVHLTAARSSIARSVEMHQSMTHEGNTMMHEMTDIAIASHGKYTMVPGDAHLMLIGLKRALAVGDSIPATLVLSNNATVKLMAVVRAP